MADQTEKTLHRLTKKVEQHEETIAQLVVIIAETNRRITDLSPPSKEDREQFVTLL